MIQTIGVGASMRSTPAGRSPVHPGGTIAQFPAPVPLVRRPGAANASVHMSYMGSSY
jgi:hypothetical protein